MKELCRTILEEVKKQNLDAAQVQVTDQYTYEINICRNEIDMIRTVKNQTVALSVIHQQRMAKQELGVDGLNPSEFVTNVAQTAAGSSPDTTFAFPQTPDHWGAEQKISIEEPELASYLGSFLLDVREHFPTISVPEGGCQFCRIKTYLANSHGMTRKVDQDSILIHVELQPVGKSFDFVALSIDNIFQPLIDHPSVREILERLSGFSNMCSISENFVGEIVLSPSTCLEFASYFLNQCQSHEWICKTSPFLNSIGKKITSPTFSLYLRPSEISGSTLINNEGLIEHDESLIYDGILKGAALTYYASRKTNTPRLQNTGVGLCVGAGQQSSANLIRSVQRGILVGRFSGGAFASNGDFSGVAKNSLLIENGKIVGAVKEIMFGGNLLAMFESFQAGSELYFYDCGKAPYALFKNVSISVPH